MIDIANGWELFLIVVVCAGWLFALLVWLYLSKGLVDEFFSKREKKRGGTPKGGAL